MSTLNRLSSYKGSEGPVLLVIADGLGLAPPHPSNAVSIAHTPTIDKMLASIHSTQLKAHGTHVGMPSDDDLGNSEVGHNTMGCGRIFDQGAKLVEKALNDGSIFKTQEWQKIESIGKNDKTIHFLGLLSDGNIHSNVDHLIKMILRCQKLKIKTVRVHALLDGRDVSPRSALKYIDILNQTLAKAFDFDGDYQLASVGGRMIITMDRYNADWNMVKRGYHCHVHGSAKLVSDAKTEIQRQYDFDSTLSDQYIEPFALSSDGINYAGKMKDGDAVVLFNFRGDRAIQISRALSENNFNQFERGEHPDIYLCGMIEYDGDFKIPPNYLVSPSKIDNTFQDYLSTMEIPSFAISETQKFGHVTYFWNGNRSGYINKRLEHHVEIPSDIGNFHLNPAMKSADIVSAAKKLLLSNDYKFGLINFPNPDMVGHTGDIEATIKAVEAVDSALEQLLETMRKLKGILIFTADHGNAEEMYIEENEKKTPKTSHSHNPVPFVIMDFNRSNNDYVMQKNNQSGIANISSTLLNLLGFEAPKQYEPSLIKFKNN